MTEIDIRHDFRQPPAAVFALLADHEAFFPPPRFVCRLLEPGSAHRNGDGALREVRSGALRFVERISQVKPDRGFDYRVEHLSMAGVPVPFRHERGWIELEPAGAGCRVRWRSRYRIALPVVGGLMGAHFRTVAGQAFAWLLRDAQRRLDAAT